MLQNPKVVVFIFFSKKVSWVNNLFLIERLSYSLGRKICIIYLNTSIFAQESLRILGKPGVKNEFLFQMLPFDFCGLCQYKKLSYAIGKATERDHRRSERQRKGITAGRIT